MIDELTNPDSVQLVGALFDRLGSQLAAQAVSEQANQAELQALKETVTDPARAKLLDAGIAQQAARARHAGELAAAVASRRASVLADLTGLMAVVARTAAQPGAPAGDAPPSSPGATPAAAGTRLINVAWTQATGPAPPDQPAAGFRPMPQWNLTYGGGPTIADLTFVNRYMGGAGAWRQDDITEIDAALERAMTDADLQTVIAQYYPGTPISSAMLPSAVDDGSVPATVYKDTVEGFARALHDGGALGKADPASSVICMMLPPGAVLSDDFSPGYAPPAGHEQVHARRVRGVLRVGEEREAADSTAGLGGYHGSIALDDGTAVYYAVGVYSETTPDGKMNGLDAFGMAWKNVVATFYHELNEARTDAAVEQANATGNMALLGWYSQAGGGEIGDLPINASGDWKRPFVEAPLSDGSGTVPVQMMWSNLDGGPALVAGGRHA